MKCGTGRMRRVILAGIYMYLGIPFMIFCIGWCRWYIGIPAAAVVAVSCVLSVKEYKDSSCGVEHLSESCVWQRGQLLRIVAVVLAVLLWAGLSGVGGYVWQNPDHPVRNGMYQLLTQQGWPCMKQDRGIVYYIGYWLPAAAVGKLFGMHAGWAVQYLWAVAGILLMYGQICVVRRKLSVWPLVLLICFSGPDALGMLFAGSDTLEVFGTQHIEWWQPDYQFSSMTTQLFWVFNQAVPVWLLSALLFLGEKPRNMVFSASLVMLTSTLPFIGIVPFLAYFMVTRCEWGSGRRPVRQLLAECWDNWGSLQNVLGGGVSALVSAVYLSGNDALRESVQVLQAPGRIFLILGAALLLTAVFWILATLAMRGFGRQLIATAAVTGVCAVIWLVYRLPYGEWQSPLYNWFSLTLFYMVEAGIFLCVLYPYVEDRGLLILNAVCLYVIPLFMLKNSRDICMRASIPGLFLIMLWCMHAMDSGIRKKGFYRICILFALLAAGSITPLHEIKRSVVNTRDYYENTAVEEDHLYYGRFFSGSTKGFFWRYMAKQ